MKEVIGGKVGLTKQFKFKSKQLRQGRSDQSKQFMLLLTSCSPAVHLLLRKGKEQNLNTSGQSMRFLIPNLIVLVK